MRLRNLSVVLATTAIVLASFAGNAGAAPPTGRVYLALGDSLAASFQPNGDTHHGYAEQLFQLEQAGIPDLRLVKLACPGERTTTIDRSRRLCPYPQGSQLDQAVAVLGSRDVAFVTLQIGSNDLMRCFRFGQAAFDQACVDDLLPALQERLATIVQALQAAEAGVTIIGATYYDPLLAAWNIPGIDHDAVLAIQDVWQSFDDALTQTYTDLGVPVADLEGAFSTTDFDTIVHLGRFGDVPINVARVCQWTYACSRRGFDPHPNTVGYAVLTRAWEAALP
jgi:lysophospholipase L1-like esterase